MTVTVFLEWAIVLSLLGTCIVLITLLAQSLPVSVKSYASLKENKKTQNAAIRQYTLFCNFTIGAVLFIGLLVLIYSAAVIVE